MLLDELSDVPVKLAPFEWRFAPDIRKIDEKPLKQALDWIGSADGACSVVATAQ
jgi:hypothetical protein